MSTVTPILPAIASPFGHTANQRGFTLIEALIAIVILIIGIVSLYTMHVGAIHGNARADSVSQLSSWASNRIEGILAQLAEQRLKPGELADTSGDATNCLDNNGIDPSGHECGLNNPKTIDGHEPDYQQLGWNCDQYLNGNNNLRSTTQCDNPTNGSGLIFVNIANDVPAQGITTIRVKVVTRDFGRQPIITTTTYFRSKPQ